MPWQECSSMSLRFEFVQLAQQPNTNFSELCRRFNISCKSGYKWLKRFQQDGATGLADQTRRPQHSPRRTKATTEQRVLALRDKYGWGARKLHALLPPSEQSTVAISTVHAILQRHGRIGPESPATRGSWQRFEQLRPNQLWQMDFKGHYLLANQQRCHPLTVLDDHSRYSLCLQACQNEQTTTVQQYLIITFRRYGLPERMLMDNGSPWGGAPDHGYTPLTVWLLRLGIAVSHSRPFHPQTQGKDERFHRTLQVEVLAQRLYADFNHMQARFDEWRSCYNYLRPHEALQMAAPASRYQPSVRAYPEQLPALEYDVGDQVRKVQATGKISFANRTFRVGRPFHQQLVAVRPTVVDGRFDIFFATHKVRTIDLKQPDE